MKKLVVVCIAVVLATGSMAFADDLFPPPWRGDEGSTFQEWGFGTPDPFPMPDFVDNPYGIPLLTVDTPSDWFDFVDGHQGVWPLSGEIDVFIPNRPSPLDYKEIDIQLVWKPSELCPSPTLPDEPIFGVVPFEFQLAFRHDMDLGGGWVFTKYWIMMSPNPSEEWLSIKGNIMVDQLVIDTICIPEPATIALLGFGALSLLRRKRA